MFTLNKISLGALRNFKKEKTQSNSFPLRGFHLYIFHVKTFPHRNQSSTGFKTQKMPKTADGFNVRKKWLLLATTLHKKWSFPLRISSKTVAKSAGTFNGNLFLCSETTTSLKTFWGFYCLSFLSPKVKQNSYVITRG